MNDLLILAVVSIPVLYIFAMSIDFSASFCRVAGYSIGKNSIGYSMQLSIFAYSRIFMMLLLPLLGYTIDSDISTKDLLIVCSFACILVGIAQLLLYFKSNNLIDVWRRKIIKKAGHKGLVEEINYIEQGVVTSRRPLIFGIIIHTLNSLSIFLPFIAASVFTENRAMLTQTSAIVNAIATFLFTMKLDPLISISIENRERFHEIHKSFVLSKIISSFFCPLVMIILCLLIT